MGTTYHGARQAVAGQVALDELVREHVLAQECAVRSFLCGVQPVKHLVANALNHSAVVRLNGAGQIRGRLRDL